MSTPIIFGAGLYHVLKMFKGGGGNTFITLPYVLGFLAAIVSSYLTIKFLLRFLQRHTFVIFALYRVLVAAVVLGLEFFKIHPYNFAGLLPTGILGPASLPGFSYHSSQCSPAWANPRPSPNSKSSTIPQPLPLSPIR